MYLLVALILLACGLALAALVRGPKRELRQLTEDLKARVEREPEKIEKVYRCTLGGGSTAVKFRGEGRMNFAGLTGAAAGELFARMCQLAPHAEKVIEPPDSPA